MIELDNTMLLFIGSENYSGKENRWPVTGSVGSNPTPSATGKHTANLIWRRLHFNSEKIKLLVRFQT